MKKTHKTCSTCEYHNTDTCKHGETDVGFTCDEHTPMSIKRIATLAVFAFMALC